MKAFAFLTTLFALSLGAKWYMEAFNLLEVYSPDTDEFTRTAWGNDVHSLLKRAWRWSLALAVWTLLDIWWLPWLQIERVARGQFEWHTVDPIVRAAIVAGYFVALGAYLVSFSLGI